MDRKCEICGRSNVDILCSKCGAFICEHCYDLDNDCCVKCSDKYYQKTSDETKILYLVGGSLLVMVGLFIATFAFIPLTGARIVVFPLVFENVNSVTAVLMSLMFFSMFAVTSLFPFYLSLKRSGSYSWDEGVYTLQESRGGSSNIIETVEYIITTEIPDRLRDTIYIEDNFDELVLRSQKDKKFNKRYSIPDDYVIDSVESAYEDGFLLLNVKLLKD
ncbi:Hsp20 family protein [Candidatus Bathyarchaeota archaeon]|nr:Hsp20 family protein [Candidatus Bathyarchaeota archaeon]